MRLDKFVSYALEISRKDAQKLIKSGTIRSSNTLKDPSTIVRSDDKIFYLDSLLIFDDKKRYILLHKPVGFVCSAVGEGNHRSALDLIDLPHKDKLHFAGRLDADTTGAVIVTDDGEFSHRVVGKKYYKTYIVELADPIRSDDILILEKGVMLRGEKDITNPAKVEKIDNKTIKLSINEGKYHQVKRMVAAIGNRVTKLHREAIGEIQLDLAIGESRFLSEKEVDLFR